jgi:hypothetical protein
MNLLLLPDGEPGEHLGISHTIKHYLRPAEAWEDVCEDIEPRYRPRAASALLPVQETPAWRQLDNPSPELAEAWPSLQPVYGQGYGRLVSTLAGPLADPGPTPDGPWAARRGRFICHAGGGIILDVERVPGGWQLYTAFRHVKFSFRQRHCPSGEAAGVSLRRTLAVAAAEDFIRRWRDQEETP